VKYLATCFILLISNIVSFETFASVGLCVQVDTEDEIKDGLFKLVLSEIGRHPSHNVVQYDCEVTLRVELFYLEKRRYLTVRIDREVPLRHEVSDSVALKEKLADSISIVLGNDPVHLAQDISQYSLVQRASHSVVKKGQNIWRIELYQTLSRGPDDLLFAPGGAIAITRGAGHWQVLARIYFGGWPGNLAENEVALRVSTGGDVGLTYEFSELSAATFYLSIGAGLQYLRYEGMVEVDNEKMEDHIDQVGVVLFSRLGVRFLRFLDFDCDLFATGYLPLFNTNETDGYLLGEDGLYTPSIQIGIGVGF
jgi:hypothetical protein